ncbi:hypothetical protein [Saccharothrix obliqua]|uniref:hypothetical protein n=1 Tax=Saccharothrix obliqua TaxID=2861747 RepID=UPI001C5EBE5B|nr:hypothetical protein [Saccharothrix obliqua]MBW4719087.1 hypothetical protein [Saccharothrix obliqua]
MTERPADDAAPTPAADAAAEEAARRRRLAEVFGDVLPETPDEPAPHRHDDQWYLENRPPHHE